MTPTTAQRTDEAAIRDLLESWKQAMLTKDMEGIMACYSSDVLAFDAIGTIQFVGAEAYRAHWEMCMGFCEGPLTMKVRDLNVVVDGSVAFCHQLVHCLGPDKDGKEQGGWMRATICLRKIDRDWKIVHEHWSAPFDHETGTVLTNLEP